MPRDPKLTNVIKNSLIPLEENLKACVRSAIFRKQKELPLIYKIYYEKKDIIHVCVKINSYYLKLH